jgi:xylose dehydrogenase (NAD/NADP)
MSKDTIRWGIVSTALIAENAFIPALRQTRGGQLCAIASRDRARAEAFAAKHDIPHVFDDYAGMLASDVIDAVYIPLPNTMHAEWTAVAAKHGKHVFCEKPLAVTVAEAEQMVADCRKAGVLLFEAFVFCYHPQSLRLRQLLDSGIIGEVRHVQAHMTFTMPRPSDNIRMQKQLGGGCLFDAGTYPITFARWILGDEPESVQALCRYDPTYEVDTRVSMLLGFSGDRHAALVTSFDAHGGPAAMLHGERGYIELPQPYHPHEESQFVVHVGQEVQTYRFNTGTRPFAPALEHFHDCIQGRAEPMLTGANACGTLRVVEAVHESARLGQLVKLT